MAVSGTPPLREPTYLLVYNAGERDVARRLYSTLHLQVDLARRVLYIPEGRRQEVLDYLAELKGTKDELHYAYLLTMRLRRLPPTQPDFNDYI